MKTTCEADVRMLPGAAVIVLSGEIDGHAADTLTAAYERAVALAPGDAEVLGGSGLFAVNMGRFDVGLAAVRHAVALDPLNPQSHEALGEALYWARRYQEAVAVFGEVISLEPDFKRAYGFRGVAYYWLGDLQSARTSCETKPDHWSSMWCLAVTYEKLGRHRDAEAELTRMQTSFGDNSAYQCATVYAAWGNTARALESLTRAVRLPDAGLVYLKADALMDPWRNEPRFQALVRELKEELGISTETACLAPAGFGTAPIEDGRELLLLLYVCRKWSGIPKALDAAALRWVRQLELHALPMPPADLPLIGLLDALI